MNYFETAQPHILNNKNLREPQLIAYQKIHKFFNDTSRTSRLEALIQLPTGTGKTGLMAISPFGISKKRVLLITPQTIVRDTVIGSFDSLDPKNFWLFTNIFDDFSKLPSVIEYNSKITPLVLEEADIVVLNIHKLQERLSSSLLKKVQPDFFDFIIIDEAHHSEAYTWKRTVEYFNEANILKVTGTPFRSDGKKITGEQIYSYPLSRAMANGYVKSLENFHVIPEEMFFTLDENSSKTYTLKELKTLNLKDADWISRKVALSENSSKNVVIKSIDLLNEKRKKTNNHPHKIVAVACSIWHAEMLKNLYEDKGLNVAIVHSNMEKKDLLKEFNRIDSHQVEVVVNVALLGEGYDHKFLSIAAIFRPFRSDLPYQQFIGRTLRSIIPSDTSDVYLEDNIAQIVHHKELNLDGLWENYKKEIIKKDIIKEIRKEKQIANEPRTKKENNGSLRESKAFEVTTDVFLETELVKKRKAEEKIEQEKIKTLMETLSINEETAKNLFIQTKTSKDKQKYLRPDLTQASLRQQIDSTIREEIIPEFLSEFGLELKGKEIYTNKDKIFSLKASKSFPKQFDNGACLGYYFNKYLMDFVGKKRELWEIEDYENAIKEIDIHKDFIHSTLSKQFEGGNDNE